MARNNLLAGSLLCIAALTALAPVDNASAMTATQYFDEGNRLFRDDLYWAALLRYRQANGEGLDTAILHYNTGIAHYRAKQHIRARESLLLALQDPGLRIASQYNLGLNAYAAGDTEEALRWFRLVRDQNTDKTLQKYAVVAISRIRAAMEAADGFEIRIAKREEKREFAQLELRARVSFGQDSNVFRTPENEDSPGGGYIDYSDPALPLIVPEVKSGAFMPLSLGAKYTVNSLPFEGFYGMYRLSGRYYQDKDLENANEYLHEAGFGSQYSRKEGPRTRDLKSAFKVAQFDGSYYDRDDGNNRFVDDVDIGERMNFLRYGPELSLRQTHEHLSVGAKLKGQLWNYEEVAAVPEYDHEYFLAELHGQYRFSEASLFRITAKYQSRRFGDRPAFDLDGQQRLGNPNIRYDYLSLGLRGRQRINDSMWLGFEMERSERSDKHVAYNDYTRDSFHVEYHWRPVARLKFAASGIYRLYDYPNAFAFHNPVVGRKEQESLDARITATYRMTERLSLVGEAIYRETDSNDLRIQYQRNQFILGVRWEQ